MSIELPENIGYGKVVGRFLLAVADGPDADRNPDGKPAVGKVTFTPVPSRLLNVSATPPVTIIPKPIECTLDPGGYLIDPKKGQGVWLIATDDPDNNPHDWPYKVDVALEGATRWTFHMKVPEGTTIDLTTVLPVSAATGKSITRGEPGRPGPRGPVGPGGEPIAALTPTYPLIPALAPGMTRVILSPTVGHDWQIGGETEGATLTLDSTRPGPFSEASFHLDSRDSTSRVWILNTDVAPIDLDDGPIVVWVYLPQSAPAGFTVEVGTGYSDKWVWGSARGSNFDDLLGRHIDGWTAFEFFAGSGAKIGNPSRDGLTYVRVIESAPEMHGYLGGVGQRMFPKTATGDLLYPNGVLSVFFDDGYMDTYAHAMPVLARHSAYGIVAVIAELSDESVDDPAHGFMPPEILRRLQDQAGWEISAHAYAASVHDRRYPNLSTEEVETDFRSLKAWLAGHGFDTSIWISPGGDFSRAVWEVGRKYFSIHRGVGPDGEQGSKVAAWSSSPRRVYSTARAPSFNTRGNGKEYMLMAIDKVKMAKSWGSIVFHRTQDGPSDGNIVGVDDLDEIMAYAASEGVPIRTVNQVMRSVSQIS